MNAPSSHPSPKPGVVPPRSPMWRTVDAARISFLCALVFWPLAAMTFVHRVLLVPQNNHKTDDFTTVFSALQRFRAHVPVYSEDYSSVDPHYLYSPGGTLLLSPLGWLGDPGIGRVLYIGANGVAAVLAVALLTWLFGFRLRGGVLPLAIFALFSTESIKNTLLFSNINGILLLLEVLFLVLLLRNKQVWAGLAIGLAITVKPQFAPLLVIPFARRQWWTVGSALAVPVAFNLAAIPLMVSPGDYLTKLVPYLGQIRDYANSSFLGVGTFYGIPAWNIQVFRAIAAVLVIVALVCLLRIRDRDPLTWASTTMATLFIGVFLISSLGQMYYSMLLLPMFFTIVRKWSVMHNPVTWLGFYLCMSVDDWNSDRWYWYGRIFEELRGTVGWSLLLVSIAASSVAWVVVDLRRRRPLLGDVATHGLFGPRHAPVVTGGQAESPLAAEQCRPRQSHSEPSQA